MASRVEEPREKSATRAVSLIDGARSFERSPRDEWGRVEPHRKGAKKWRNKRSNLQTKGQISLNGGMHKGSRNDDDEKEKRRILKRYQVSETQESEQKFDALFNQNTYQPATSGGPVREGRTTEKSLNTQGSPSKPNKRRHSNNLKDFERRIKSSFVRAGCSKHCTGIKDAHAPRFAILCLFRLMERGTVYRRC